jgi:putative SOS response-associated peptidase YedK
MCGRFAAMNMESEGLIPSMIKKLAVKVKKDGGVIKTSGEIFPTDTVPVIVGEEEVLSVAPMTWGYPGFPDKRNPKAKPRPLINAKSETAGALRTWSDSVSHRRCLIPTGGFYEWDHNSGEKTKYLFYLIGEESLYLGGIYKEFKKPEGKVVNFSILTMAANDTIKDIHDRMPLVVLPSEFDVWLYGAYESLYERKGVKLSRKAQKK